MLKKQCRTILQYSSWKASLVEKKLAGDQHWGELLAKKMPASEEFGDQQVDYDDDDEDDHDYYDQDDVDEDDHDDVHDDAGLQHWRK